MFVYTCVCVKAVEVRVGSGAGGWDEEQRIGSFAPTRLSEQVSWSWAAASHSSHSRGFVPGVEVSSSRGREVWERRMLCAPGSTSRVNMSNLLIETNASCQRGPCSARDEGQSRGAWLPQLLVSSSRAVLFSWSLRVGRIQWLKAS